MRICFLADAGSVNTKSWAEYFADVFVHDVHVISVSPAAAMSPNVTIHDLSAIGPHAGVWAHVTKIWRVRSLVWKIRPDLLVGYRVPSYGFLGALTGFRPLAAVAQGQNVACRPHPHLKRLSVRHVFRTADMINSWAPHMTRNLVGLGCPSEKLLTCPRGIDLELFPPRDGGESEHTLIATRALHRRYMVDVIVGALAIVAEEFPSASAAILGEGEAAGELEALASELGVRENVWFGGATPYAELPAHLGRSEIYVSAVPMDGVSASLLEGMACGCFPIVWANDANRHWIDDGVNGLLVDGGASEYADAILRALRDDAWRARAAEMNRKIVEERGNLARNMRTIDAAYEELVRSYCGADERSDEGAASAPGRAQR